MVKVGFICEGDTEQIFLGSDAFQNHLASLKLESLPIINAKGSGNLLPHNISGYIERLEKQGAEVILILTDLDDDICITETKDRISARKQDIVVIAVKKIESWFLACSPTIQQLLGQPGFHFDDPEKENEPFERINALMLQYRGRGIGKKSAGKVKLATRMIEMGFDISNAASHANCSSAQYLLKKLKDIGKKVIASILFMVSFATTSHAQTHKDSVLTAIRATFQQTNRDKTLRVIHLDEDDFTDENTDNGGELSGYFKVDTLTKIVLEVGLSYAMMRWEYYFDKGQIIFIYETEKDYPEDSTTLNLINDKIILAFEGRYYYDNGALINTIFKGKKRFVENNASAYIKALPSKPEIDGYIKLLKNRAR
jgi:hypothetical protein